jgi:hypothetical protein
MSDKDVELRISGDSSEAESAFGRVGTASQEAAYKMAESFEKINSKMEGVNKLFEKMAGMIAISFGSEKIIESVRNVAEYADEVDKSSQKTGIAADKLQGLQFAAKMSDISAKDLDNSLKKLANAMEGAGVAGSKGAEAFAAVGLKASDLKNMKTDEVLAKVADAFQNSQDGAGKAAIAMQLFGKSGTDMIPFLNKGSGSITELIAQAQKMGLVMSGDALESAGRLDDQFKLMDAQIEGLQRRASSALVPAFLQITNAFSQSTQQGGAMSGVFDGLGEVLLMITKVASYVAQLLQADGIIIGATAASVMSAVTGDFKGAKMIMEEGYKDIAASAKKFDAFRESLEKPVNVPKINVPSEGGNKKDLHLGNGAEASQMSVWKAQLEAKKEVEGQYFKSSLADDEQFWQAKLALADKGSKDEIAIKHELYGIHKQLAVQKYNDDQEALKTEMAAARAGSQERINLAFQTSQHVGETYGFESKEYQAALKDVKKAGEDFDKEQEKLESMKVQRARDHSMAMIGMERDRLTQMKSLGQISDLDEIAALKVLKEKEYQLELQAQQDKIALMKEEGPARQQQLDDLAKMQDKHDAEMQQLDNQRVLAIKKNWDSVLNPISNAFDQSLTGMIQGTQTFQQSMARMGQSILAEFIKMGVTRVTTWIGNELAMTTASVTGNTARSIASKTGSSDAMQAKGTEATAVVSSSAAEAASGAASAVAAIPVIGPALAATSFASIMAMVMGAGSMIKSSAGGEWQVPHDRLNLVHKDETILPAYEAGQLRSMVAGGNGSGGGDVHFHGQGGDFIHKKDLAAYLRQMKRNFVLVP